MFSSFELHKVSTVLSGLILYSGILYASEVQTLESLEPWSRQPAGPP